MENVTSVSLQNNHLNMFQMYGSLMSQPVSGNLFREGKNWIRIWFMVWWIGCIVVKTGYTGNLIAFLTVPLFPNRAETLQDIAESPLR